MGHGSEIVSLRVPHDSLYDILEGNLDHLSCIDICTERPFPELLFLIVKKHILVIVLLRLFNQFRGRRVDFSGIQTRIYYVNDLFISCSQNASVLAGIPFNAINNFVVKFVFS